MFGFGKRSSRDNRGVEYTPWQIAGMIRQSLIDNHGYQPEHPYCKQAALEKKIAEIQKASNDKKGKKQFGVTDEGAASIAAAIAREDARVLIPHNMRQEYFSPLLTKLLIQQGSYKTDEQGLREKGMQTLARDVYIEAYNWPGNTVLAPKFLLCNQEKCDALIEALGSGDVGAYENALGSQFWEQADFQKKTGKHKNQKYNSYGPSADRIATAAVSATPKKSSPAAAADSGDSVDSPKKRSGMKNAATVMGMVGLGAVAAYGFATNDPPEQKAPEKDASGEMHQPPPQEKSFWAQPRKYLALAATLGLSAWGLYLYNQNKTAKSQPSPG